MADELDMASEREEIERSSARHTCRKPVPAITANGRCHECKSIVGHGMRWCDALCRDEWEANNQSLQR